VLSQVSAWHLAPAKRPLAAARCVQSKLAAEPFDLILLSGFLCFLAQAGFIAALKDRGVLAAGYSAGEIADVLLSKQRLIALVRLALPWRGFASTRKLEWLMRELLPPTFKQLNTPLALRVYHTCWGEHSPLLLTEGDLPSAVAASCAVPWLFAPMQQGSNPCGPYARRGAYSPNRRPSHSISSSCPASCASRRMQGSLLRLKSA
jgi:predicted acylesterase/phospholipase RssA